jgi:molybdate transport system substrate-binding protein
LLILKESFMYKFQTLRLTESAPGRCLVIVGLLLLLAACSAPPSSADRTSAAEELLVFAASSLTDAFDEMIRAFEVQNSGVRVVVNYGGSSGLATQLLEGSVADVFASANSAQMQRVVDAGEIVDDPPVFATNRLVLIVPADNPGNIETLADLANPGLMLILAMRGVPVRDYTDQMLAELAADPAYGSAYSAAVYANLVSEEENVRQVVAKVALGEADAGVVYRSDVTPDVAPNLSQIEVPDAYNVIAAYPIARLADAPHPAAAAAFLDFVLSDEGQSILNRWGFGSARP